MHKGLPQGRVQGKCREALQQSQLVPQKYSDIYTDLASEILCMQESPNGPSSGSTSDVILNVCSACCRCPKGFVANAIK